MGSINPHTNTLVGSIYNGCIVCCFDKANTSLTLTVIIHNISWLACCYFLLYSDRANKKQTFLKASVSPVSPASVTFGTHSKTPKNCPVLYYVRTDADVKVWNTAHCCGFERKAVAHCSKCTFC